MVQQENHINIQQEVSNLEDENFEQEPQEKNNKKPIDNEQN